MEADAAVEAVSASRDGREVGSTLWAPVAVAKAGVAQKGARPGGRRHGSGGGGHHLGQSACVGCEGVGSYESAERRPVTPADLS